MNRPLLDSALIESMLTRDAPWCESHGAQDAYVGADPSKLQLGCTSRRHTRRSSRTRSPRPSAA